MTEAVGPVGTGVRSRPARNAGIDVRHADLASPSAQSLIRALNAELAAMYPEPGATHFRLEADEVAAGRGAFVVAFDGDEPVGCGALRRIDADAVEIKRMYVVPERRGAGIGRLILSRLEDEARRLGARRLVLETGTRQVEALGLYRQAGFTPIPVYGEYIGSPVSVCLGKDVG